MLQALLLCDHKPQKESWTNKYIYLFCFQYEAELRQTQQQKWQLRKTAYKVEKQKHMLPSPY